jgi:hypothetical protein
MTTGPVEKDGWTYIDARNADLARERVGPLYLTVEHLKTEVPA